MNEGGAKAPAIADAELPATGARIAAIMALLLLGAHFLRRGDLGFVVVCLALCLAVLVRRRGWTRIVIAALVLGAGVWLRTLATGVAERAAIHEGAFRLAAILGAVLLFTLGAAFALLSATHRREGWRWVARTE